MSVQHIVCYEMQIERHWPLCDVTARRWAVGLILVPVGFT
jgi:hypothetical protein